MNISERLTALRQAMQEKKVDYCYFITRDFHGSEYISDYFKTVEYFSGFTGSNAELLIWQEGGALWTDGRYFVQAEKELEGSGIKMLRMGNPQDDTLDSFLKNKLKRKEVLAFDGRIVSIEKGRKIAKAVTHQHAKTEIGIDFADIVWKDRPALPDSKAYLLGQDIVGKTLQEKLEAVRIALVENAMDGVWLNRLDDIMWLLNLRGNDIACNPVVMCTAYINFEKMVLFIRKSALDFDVRMYLAKHGVDVCEYGTEEEFCKGLKDLHIAIDPETTPYVFLRYLSEMELYHLPSPVQSLKAVKNDVEIRNMEQFYLRDSIAVTKFIYWIKHKADLTTLTEYDAAMYLDKLRSEIPGFLELSFPTISAYGSNAAMMHYQATKDQAATLQPEGFLLVDSGGQYLGATTDVTRTIALGPLSQEMKQHYTLVARGMLSLSNAAFLAGCTGRNLDILARKPLWDMGLDYLCGTGHGVGYILNVHEGPQGIRWKYKEKEKETVLEEGMVVTDEPGVYLTDQYGIRIENVLLVKARERTEYGQFLGFASLTWVPLEPKAILPELMERKELEYYNQYQNMVYEKVKDYLTEEEKRWLYEETRPILPLDFLH